MPQDPSTPGGGEHPEQDGATDGAVPVPAAPVASVLGVAEPTPAVVSSGPDAAEVDELAQPADASPQGRRRALWLGLAAVILIALGVGFFYLEHRSSGLYALAPGSATPVAGAISVKPPTPVFPHQGRFLFVTVSLRTVGPFDYLFDRMDSNIQLIHQKALVGSSKPSQLNQADAVQMQTSTQTAVIVALRRLGYTVTVTNRGAQVNEVNVGTPADGHLAPGDVITAVDQTAVATNDALVTELRKHKPGDDVSLTVKAPDGKTRTETIKLGTSPPSQGPPHAFIGIVTQSKQDVTLPIGVTIDPGNVGGPSAGLAFTLGIINELTRGDLAGGHTVAVTGTIEPDGSVGDVGGVIQKTAAVRKTKAIAFLVPPGEYKDASTHAGSHLKVIKVTSLEDALNALRSLGGDLSGVGPAPASTPASS